ncbi:ACT domain-containing protein [Actinoallomurus rhizosphaericola]|uniref:ACT domain-containing protein n=1 Tax=Actinoallomurus rhizosphaericola TaxID=2952536 RepID=UPI0020935F23|nr:ACT domain-containing protein [Actinoallomurus rhizosphaericola]MCO5998127.1 ACT domain-containing protein [Actinoallomurus rhizosphaericola]
MRVSVHRSWPGVGETMVAGETDLRRLLAGLDPLLHEDEYVFVTSRDRETPAGVEPVLVFEETEGRTLVLPRAQAEKAGLDGVFPSAWITLRIHSSLEAVGMMAAVTAALAEAGISCNAVSAFYHDHLFVPRDRAGDAIAVLRDLAG